MYTKTLAAAIAGITVAGAVMAGGQDPAMSAPVAAQNCSNNASAQGNSVWSANTLSIAGGKVCVGGMASLDAFYSKKN